MGERVRQVLRAACGGPIELDQALDRALDFGVEATLLHEAEALGWSGEEVSTWRAHKRALVAHTMALRADLWEVYRMLSEELGRALVLKGEPLAVELFGSSHARRSGDVDVMCAPHEIEGAWRALRLHRYRPLHGERPEPWRYNQWACVKPNTGRVVELHWALSAPSVPSPDFEALYEQSVARELNGFGAVRALGASDQLLHVAYHHHHHMGALKGLLDVAAWWDRYAERRPELLAESRERARALGVEALLLWPIAALRRLDVSGGESGELKLRAGGLGEAFGAWSAWRVQGAFQRRSGLSSLGFKSTEEELLEATIWRLLGMAMVRGGARRALEVLISSPREMSARRGAEQVSGEDWEAWGGEVGRRFQRALGELLKSASR